METGHIYLCPFFMYYWNEKEIMQWNPGLMFLGI